MSAEVAFAYARGLQTIGTMRRSAGQFESAARFHDKSARVALAHRSDARLVFDAHQAASHARQEFDVAGARRSLAAAREIAEHLTLDDQLNVLTRKAELLYVLGQPLDALRVHEAEIGPRLGYRDAECPTSDSIRGAALAGLLMAARGPRGAEEALEVLSTATAGAAYNVTIRRDLLVQSARCRLRLGDVEGAAGSEAEARALTQFHGLSVDGVLALRRELRGRDGGPAR